MLVFKSALGLAKMDAGSDVHVSGVIHCERASGDGIGVRTVLAEG